MSVERDELERRRLRPPPPVEQEGLLERITPYQADQRFAEEVDVYERRPGGRLLRRGSAELQETKGK